MDEKSSLMDNGSFSWMMVQGPAAPALSLASVGFSALGSMESASGTASADEYKANELDRSAVYGELKATQVNAEMTRNLSATLANIDAVQMASHLDPRSPTSAAVREQTGQVGTEKKNIAVDSIMAEAQQNEADAAYMRHAASAAMTSGMLGAGADIFKGFAGLAA